MDHSPLHRQLFTVTCPMLGMYFLQVNQSIALPSLIFILLGWNNWTSCSVAQWMAFCHSGEGRGLISFRIRICAVETFPEQHALTERQSYLTAFWPQKIQVFIWIRNILFFACVVYIGAYLLKCTVRPEMMSCKVVQYLLLGGSGSLKAVISDSSSCCPYCSSPAIKGWT